MSISKKVELLLNNRVAIVQEGKVSQVPFVSREKMLFMERKRGL